MFKWPIELNYESNSLFKYNYVKRSSEEEKKRTIQNSEGHVRRVEGNLNFFVNIKSQFSSQLVIRTSDSVRLSNSN